MSIAGGTELGNNFCIAVVVVVVGMSLDLVRKTPIIQMIDVCYMKSTRLVLNDNSCKTESAKRSLYGNYGLVHFDSCSLNEVIIWLLGWLLCSDTPNRVNKIAGMKLLNKMATFFSAQLEVARCSYIRPKICSQQTSAIA